MAAPSGPHASDEFTPETDKVPVDATLEPKTSNEDKNNIILRGQAATSKQSWMDRRRHTECVERADFACKHNPYVKFMMTAMARIGCPVDRDTHFVCEPCSKDSPVNGGFDPVNGQIVLCENKSPSQRILSTLLTHELIHAYDHCRADVDWRDIRHVACSEIRASSLSGDCSFLSDSLYGWNFRFRKQHQTCVRRRAISSILAVRDVTKQDAERAVDEVWETCFKDYAPFTKIPQSPADLKESSHDKPAQWPSNIKDSSQNKPAQQPPS